MPMSSWSYEAHNRSEFATLSPAPKTGGSVFGHEKTRETKHDNVQSKRLQTIESYHQGFTVTVPQAKIPALRKKPLLLQRRRGEAAAHRSYRKQQRLTPAEECHPSTEATEVDLHNHSLTKSTRENRCSCCRCSWVPTSERPGTHNLSCRWHSQS